MTPRMAFRDNAAMEPHFTKQDASPMKHAAEKARAAGITVVMDRCIYKDYVALFL